MKRPLFTIVLLALAVALFADEYDWQQRRHSFNVSVGLPSLYSTIIGGHSWSFYIAPPSTNPSGNSNAEIFCGSYAAEYGYNILRWLSIGAQLNYEYWTGGYRTTDVNLLAMVNFTYINREHITLYSGLGTGVGLHIDKRANGAIEGTYLPSFILTPIGLRAGNEKVYGMVETNIGAGSCIRVGIGARF